MGSSSWYAATSPIPAEARMQVCMWTALYATGSKSGYVVDICQNDGPELWKLATS